MDDFLRRLGVVESLVAQTREDVSAIKGAFTHLATKADLNDLKGDVSAIKAALPHLATKADLDELKADVREIKATLPHLATKAEINGVRSDLSTLETRIIRWFIGTTIAAVSVAFTIAKIVN